MCAEKLSITLLLNTNKIFDRNMITGIAQYINTSNINWTICLEEEMNFSNEHLRDFAGDGIIASFDTTELEQKLQYVDVPIIGVSGSIAPQNNHLSLPYVATDNFAIVELAYQHLKAKGLQSFAFYGLPQQSEFCWSLEREQAFNALVKKDNYQHSIHRDSVNVHQTSALHHWLNNLPKPVGIVCATDARARQVINACEQLAILVPQHISVIGIDNDDISQSLSKIALSSVQHECKTMGFKATQLLHKLIKGRKVPPQTVISPTTIHPRQSSDYLSLHDPEVMQAMHFIQNNATRGIKVDQVLYHLGVSRSTIEPRFIEEVGHTIHTEIHNRKVEKACSHLAQTSITLKEVAAIAGYPSLQYMYSIFKKRFNLTPKQYRQHKQSINEPECETT